MTQINYKANQSEDIVRVQLLNKIKERMLHHLLQWIELEASTAILDSSFSIFVSKFWIPPFLKKFGSATTKPRVETSIICTRTVRLLNSLALTVSKLEYFWSL